MAVGDRKHQGAVLNVSARSYFTSAIAALSVSAVLIAPVHAPPEIAVTANRVAAQSVVSQAMVDLLAAVQRLTPSVSSTGPSATVTAAPAPHSVASDAIINAWNFVLPWIDYGVNLVDGALG
jgi:hypothetical protein